MSSDVCTLRTDESPFSAKMNNVQCQNINQQIHTAVLKYELAQYVFGQLKFQFATMAVNILSL